MTSTCAASFARVAAPSFRHVTVMSKSDDVGPSHASPSQQLPTIPNLPPLSITHSSPSYAQEEDVQRRMLDPSSAFANIMWFRGPYNTQVFVGETESGESVVRRFKKACMEANIVNECRRRRFFETKQEAIKRKAKDAMKLRRRLARQGGGFSGNRQFNNGPRGGAERGSNAEDDDDNWAEPETLTF
eukprot:TRINITY_DN634_c0_g1_i1.p1 TRINITY_DN634_c0_g1~~TRINITY_DN634_c0_g1_i1.p1  ORF type:complete len:204 (-),score=38.40 TRINITY_DN634_c0_g1_i1:313-873(-)